MQQLEQAQLNQYVGIQRRLAHGGMSDIYLAHDAHEQTVALKVVHSSQDDYVIRFRREVQTLYHLNHKHILPILDSGADGSWHYCVMPYMPTGTLRNRLHDGPLSLEEAGTILTQVAAALQYAHEQGMLHRDIKPSNILLGDNSHVYLADFGLAKGITNGGDLTQTGCLIGTPEYMAPELAERPAAISSDIYSLGIVLYQMLTGQVPFKGHTPMSIYWKHIQEQPLPPSQLNPAISPAIEQVILCALEKDPTCRFPSVQALAEAYNRALCVSSQLHSVPERSLLVDRAERVTLPPPMQRVIPLAAMSAQRRFHPAIIAFVAVFFLLVVPFTLGFSLYLNDHGYGLQAQAPTALGASAQFTKLNGLTQEGLPHTRPVIITTTTITSLNVHPYNHPSQGNPGGGNGGNHGHGRGHGHKHGHGH